MRSERVLSKEPRKPESREAALSSGRGRPLDSVGRPAPSEGYEAKKLHVALP